MEPFDSYPQGGRALLGQIRNLGNCRPGYGRKFMRITGQRRCAYCGLDFTASYRDWLQMELDHVVTQRICAALRLHQEWVEDASNKVLACRPCNGFENRYSPSFELVCPHTLDEFFNLRDRVFSDRMQKILVAHERAQSLFAARPWEPSAARRLVQIRHAPAAAYLRPPVRAGACKSVWDAMDALAAAQMGVAPTIQQLRALAVTRGWNASNAQQEFYRWRAHRNAAEAASSAMAGAGNEKRETGAG
jgi:hypothetical protein